VSGDCIRSNNLALCVILSQRGRLQCGRHNKLATFGAYQRPAETNPLPLSTILQLHQVGPPNISSPSRIVFSKIVDWRQT